MSGLCPNGEPSVASRRVLLLARTRRAGQHEVRRTADSGGADDRGAGSGNAAQAAARAQRPAGLEPQPARRAGQGGRAARGVPRLGRRAAAGDAGRLDGHLDDRALLRRQREPLPLRRLRILALGHPGRGRRDGDRRDGDGHPAAVPRARAGHGRARHAGPGAAGRVRRGGGAAARGGDLAADRDRGPGVRAERLHERHHHLLPPPSAARSRSPSCSPQPWRSGPSTGPAASATKARAVGNPVEWADPRG